MKSSSNLRIGLIGCGSLGLFHAQNIEHYESANLVAVSSHRMESAKKLSNSLVSSPKAYNDHKKMIKETDLDAVLIVTPNFSHCSIAIDAAEAGLHVFCEKPMALSVKDCDRMIAATEKSSVFLMIGYLRRFEKKYIHMKRLIESGKIGELKAGHILLLYSRPMEDSKSWVLDRDQYGGLYSFFSHELDQLTWMMGEIKKVQSMMQFNDIKTSMVEETVSMNLEFQSGIIASLYCSRVYKGGRSEFGISGTKGTLSISDNTLMFYPIDGEPEQIICEDNNAYQAELDYFFECITENREPVPNGVDGRRTLVIATAAYESAMSGNTVLIKNQIV